METLSGMHWFWFGLIGLLGGTISSLLGVGSGILVVPALVLGMGFEQKAAQGTCLAMMVPMALMGSLRYHWNPDIRIHFGIVAILAVAAVVGANIGSTLAGVLPAAVLRKLFGFFVIAAGVRMLMVR